MYGKTYKLYSSPGLAPAEALFLQSSLAFDRLHNHIKIFNVACSYRKLLKTQRPHGECNRTIAVGKLANIGGIKILANLADDSQFYTHTFPSNLSHCCSHFPWQYVS